MPPYRGDPRLFVVLSQQFRSGARRGVAGVPPAEAGSVLNEQCNAGLKARSTRDQNTAISGKLPPQLGRIRPGFVHGRLARLSLQFAANSGTGSHELTANCHVWNILAGMQPTVHQPGLISYVVSITYLFAVTSSSRLTPYSRIFCRQVSTGQLLADHPRKILKTNDFKPSDFNILQNCACKLLKTWISFLLFCLRGLHHGSQNL